MINIKAQQTLVKFNKQDPGTWLYLMRPETYSKLTESKVIDEAAVRSGIQRGALKGAWDAIGAVIKAWTTEGHSVAIPGLGSIRFSMNATAVADVNKVAKELIHTRKVVFTPSVDIKNELKNTKVSITCIDKDGKIVKRTTSSALQTSRKTKSSTMASSRAAVLPPKVAVQAPKGERSEK